MADEIDVSSRIEDSLKERQIQAIRSRGRELEPVGECHNCDEPFEEGSPKLFCDRHCSDQWERRRR